MAAGEIRHRNIETNGIRMHIVEQGEGPLVVMCHGFPESWYSWRHQLPALAAAGFHAVAPDMRGYGQTDRPEAIDQYTLFHLAGDIVGLLDALGAEEAVIAGHDWGAPVAWHAALLRPDRFRGVIGLSAASVASLKREPEALRRSKARLRPMVTNHVKALPRDESKSRARRQTWTKVSCKQSSASARSCNIRRMRPNRIRR